MPDLVRVLGPDLWQAVQHHKEIDRGEKLVRFFVCVSMSLQTGLIDESTFRETAHIVIRNNPLQVGFALREVLDESDLPCKQVWREFVRPWLHRFWPREKTLNTGQSSSALVGVIMATGDAFPEAVDWANGYLMALNDRQISTVCYHKKRGSHILGRSLPCCTASSQRSASTRGRGRLSRICSGPCGSWTQRFHTIPGSWNWSSGPRGEIKDGYCCVGGFRAKAVGTNGILFR